VLLRAFEGHLRLALLTVDGALPIAAFAITAALALGGCGGKVTYVEGSGGAGSSSSSSKASSSNATSSGNQTSSPSVGTGVSTGSGQVPNCLDLGFGGIGQQCNQEGAECAIPSACCGGHAFCKGGTWIPEAASCNEPCVPCGDGSVFWGCDLGAVCVVDELELATTFQCAPSPCFEDLDCGCAASLCEMNFLDCVGAKDSTTLVCSCFACDTN